MEKWRKNMKHLKYLTIAALSTILLAGCNNTQETSDSNKESITVALEVNTRPLSFTDDNGDLTGYEVDIINEVNKVIKDYKIEIETVSAEAAEVGIESGKYEIVGGGLFKTDERQKKYLFPDENTGVSTVEIYKRKGDDEIQKLEDLVDKTISPVTANGGIFNLLTKYNDENPDKQVTINLGESGELAERFTKLNDGDYDAVVLPANFGAEDIIDQLNLDVVTADEPIQVNGTYFIISKKEKEFKKHFDDAISQLKSDGTFSELSTKWFGEDMFQYSITE